MFKRSLIAASLSVAALVSAQAMAEINGGGSSPAPPTRTCIGLVATPN